MTSLLLIAFTPLFYVHSSFYIRRFATTALLELRFSRGAIFYLRWLAAWGILIEKRREESPGIEIPR